ncbi:hypothetical protein SAMN04490357_1745 [Streptomyces misionensis]|uniref:Uncharacterized protein n=1 Tax=Streptomyces misionensis TaxID=67331 RepID=A0A1H4RND8_9ACTN|nr:hypothetical protein [Streptomyces misionensis]SEC33369.1 hypothetical protein SAMN04490357_1745 [Streptomyces misionensis]
MNNPELAAARAAVPQIATAEKLLQAAKELLTKAPVEESPEAAREAVIERAADAFLAGGAWPKQVGHDAAKAYAEADVALIERQARQRAVIRAEWAVHDALTDHSSAALEHLGKRLEEVLSAARTAFETIGGARTAEDVISAGGDAVAAWTRLRELTADLENIRRAQWILLAAPRVPGGSASDRDARVHLWKRAAAGHVRGLNPDTAPAFARDAILTGRVTLEFLRWTATQEGAFVPTSDDEVEAEIATSRPDASDGEGLDISPAVVPAREYRPSQVYDHSTAPHLDASQPTPAKPTPNATVGDPAPFVPHYT